jgi:hypothetical protein
MQSQVYTQPGPYLIATQLGWLDANTPPQAVVSPISLVFLQ